MKSRVTKSCLLVLNGFLCSWSRIIGYDMNYIGGFPIH